MLEMWDIYDINRKKTGRLAERDVYEFKEGEFHIVVQAIIMNSKNELLISKRAANKGFGLMWEFNGGSVLAGETSLEGIIREVKEELGIEFTKKEAIFFKEILGYKIAPNFKDMWLFRKDIDIKDITFPDRETIEAKWVSIDEFMEMFKNKEIIPVIDFGLEEYSEVLKIQQRESYKYIGKTVKVIIDRPMYSKHPEYEESTYPINYGYVPNTISGDGKELDCFILGVDEPLNEFEGECIAVIHRLNDDDDKLVVVPTGQKYTDEEIREKTYFQEQYFESEIIR